ncbi:hypothetical protein PG994_003362 [Apiospora phragmitis]|uniref:BTB domain-containing protein n=1 Tax=Apiospora phragmitis TaxID=2905665 RepID=A0ABR1VXX8_9PEZI
MSPKTDIEATNPLGKSNKFDLLRSRTVKFIIGTEKIEFHVHPGFIAEHSPLLDALVTRAIEGVSEGCLIWEDVNHDIFLRFLEFTYTGDYTCAASVAIEQDKSDVHTSPTPPMTVKGETLNFSYSLVSCSQAADTAAFSCPHNVDGRVGKKRKISDILCDCGLLQARKRTISEFTTRYITADTNAISPKHSVQRPVEFFIEHAQVWLFAHKYAVNPLVDLAVAKFVHDLAEWKISNSSFVAEFGRLVRYLYANTDIASQLRLILSHFGACVVDDVAALDGWKALLEEVPSFSMDLLSLITDQRVMKRPLTLTSTPSLLGQLPMQGIFDGAGVWGSNKALQHLELRCNDWFC